MILYSTAKSHHTGSITSHQSAKRIQKQGEEITYFGPDTVLLIDNLMKMIITEYFKKTYALLYKMMFNRNHFLGNREKSN